MNIFFFLLFVFCFLLFGRDIIHQTITTNTEDTVLLMELAGVYFCIYIGLHSEGDRSWRPPISPFWVLLLRKLYLSPSY